MSSVINIPPEAQVVNSPLRKIKVDWGKVAKKAAPIIAVVAVSAAILWFMSTADASAGEAVLNKASAASGSEGVLHDAVYQPGVEQANLVEAGYPEGTQVIGNADGSTTIKYPDGATVDYNTDGSVTVTDAKGNVAEYKSSEAYQQDINNNRPKTPYYYNEEGNFVREASYQSTASEPKPVLV